MLCVQPFHLSCLRGPNVLFAPSSGSGPPWSRPHVDGGLCNSQHIPPHPSLSQNDQIVAKYVDTRHAHARRTGHAVSFGDWSSCCGSWRRAGRNDCVHLHDTQLWDIWDQRLESMERHISGCFGEISSSPNPRSERQERPQHKSKVHWRHNVPMWAKHLQYHCTARTVRR